ncbi:zinc-dependent metalloprotease [Olivibacter sp. XZL3]|uniref:zinc-dependent metalloprotease n=1 Tax=Olivibacter sp. XZL3 TaxID=1735116 RepID=UPI001065787B|nr:zinc-dependent metalloprotease [Olivibacter sp. XZL3]
MRLKNRFYKPLLITFVAVQLMMNQGLQAQNKPTNTKTSSTESISQKVSGLAKYPGYFNFYYDDKSGKVYLEVEKFDTEFLYYTSLTDGVGSGGPERGQASAAIAKFTKVGPKILLIQPNYAYRAITDNKDEQKAVENAFAQSVIYSFTPIANDGDKVLIDFTPFIIRDSQKIAGSIGRNNLPGINGGSAASSGAAYHVDESRSAVYMPNTKNFPKNTEFEAVITFVGGGNQSRRWGAGSSVAPDPNAVTIKMHQSLIELPEEGYRPRKFDPRSGFNMFSYMDFSAPMKEPIVKRFTRRQRLAKKDPKAALSEAVKPIVYYVDRGAPEPIKKALIEGGSWWNQAFEAAGYKNAFQIKELPEGADPMDIRYNIVNWINRTGNPRAYSTGMSHIDPRTGEIIKGVVTLGADRHRQDYLIAEGLLQCYEDGTPVSDELEQFALARVRQLSAHEIGHTLGLYHNFTASTKDRASVMDYPFPRFSMNKQGRIEVTDAYARGIGEWDKRAILWGYQDFPEGVDENEALDEIMKKTLADGHIFIPDIGGYVHPISNQWDEGTNAVDELERLISIRSEILNKFSEKAIPQNAPMATLEEVLVPMYLLHRYQIEAAAKSIGGLYFTHALKNDGQTVTEMLLPKEQWKALDALLKTIQPASLALPESLIQKIPPRPSGYPQNPEVFKRYTGPTFDPIAAAETIANTTFGFLFDPARAARLIEYKGRDAKQPGFIPIAEKILDATWKTPLNDGYHGELEAMRNSVCLQYLLQLAAHQEASPVVKGQALFLIDELENWMKEQVGGASPAYASNLRYGLSQIAAFKHNPTKFEVAPLMEMPQGAPIGMPAMDFMSEGFCSFN